jgi:hypothetical protein
MRMPQIDAAPRTVPLTSLRDGRPEPADRSGLPCERCEAETAADELRLIDGRFLCRECAGLLSGLATRARRIDAMRNE